jgi:hypothetical protein
MKNQSLYDPTRKTVGAMYLDAQKNNKEDRVEVGDLSRELMSSLVTDLNETIASNPHEGKEFYITVHESKDLQMPRLIRRRMLTSVYRPYPEDDTVVFWVNPATNQVKFCWCLPHWSEMDNILACPNLFEKEHVEEVKAWKREDLHFFGFKKDEIGNWMPNEHWKGDKDLQNPSNKVQILKV